MSKGLIIGAVIIVILALAIGGYFFFKKETDPALKAADTTDPALKAAVTKESIEEIKKLLAAEQYKLYVMERALQSAATSDNAEKVRVQAGIVEDLKTKTERLEVAYSSFLFDSFVGM